jgi:hypothetical protein
MMGNLPEEAVENKARWVRVSVETFDHEILDMGRYDRRSAWLWLITNAAWKERRVNHKGRPITLKRGQLLGARAFLAEKFGWGEQELRTFLKALVTNGMVEINQSNGHFANVITICNYEKYQSAENAKDQASNQSLTSVQPVSNQISTKGTSYTNNTPGERASADEIARQAYLDGERIKQGLVAKSARAIQRCKGELDGSRGVTFTDGKLEVSNGTRAALEKDFPGVDLSAVCDRAGPEVAKFSYPTVADAVSVIRKWARIAGEDRRPVGAQSAPFEDWRAKKRREDKEFFDKALGGNAS